MCRRLKNIILVFGYQVKSFHSVRQMIKDPGKGQSELARRPRKSLQSFTAVTPPVTQNQAILEFKMFEWFHLLLPSTSTSAFCWASVLYHYPTNWPHLRAWMPSERKEDSSNLWVRIFFSTTGAPYSSWWEERCKLVLSFGNLHGLPHILGAGSNNGHFISIM